MMLNILDVVEKKKVLMEYRLRLAVISAIALTVIVSASLLLLFPSYLLAVSKFNNAQNDVNTLEMKTGSGTQERDIAAQIRAVNNEITLLSDANTSKTKILPAEAIADILKIRTAAIKISAFTYDNGGGQTRLVLTGTAADRDSLSAFVDALKNNPTYSSADLPISSYVKSTNISFSIMLTVRAGGTSAKSNVAPVSKPF